MSLPRITEVARLWADPEIRYTKSGVAVVTVPLVFSKRRKNESTGQWEDAGTLFVRGQAWEKAAENIGDSLSKGDEVLVSGELSMREFERQDGTKGQSLEMSIFAIGPSLRYATAKVQKAARSGAQSTPDPWGASSEPAPF